MHFLFRETACDKLPAYRFQNTASYSMKEQNEQRMTDIEDIDSPGMGIRVRTTAPVCYGRNMTFPRPTSSYAHRHELPAIVTEGESCRLLAEVKDDDDIVLVISSQLGGTLNLAFRPAVAGHVSLSLFLLHERERGGAN